MRTRYINQIAVSELGLGCMNLNHAYEPKLGRESVEQLLKAAFDSGITHFDTAALYGFGVNEEWVGAAIKSFRSRVFLASKCGMTGVNGKRVIDGRPATLIRNCADALQRLQVDYIDLYYLHRWDKQVPIEESVGALSELVTMGYIGAIGLSEVSAATLTKANAVYPIAAVQNEYSLWTRNPELGLLETCRELDVTLVAFSPLGRGFLAGRIDDVTRLAPTDLRRSMPRFQSPHFERNLKLLVAFDALAIKIGCTKAQLALAWLLQRAPYVVPIFGTTLLSHLHEDIAASDIMLSSEIITSMEMLFNSSSVSGGRYPPEVLTEVDTEESTLPRDV